MVLLGLWFCLSLCPFARDPLQKMRIIATEERLYNPHPIYHRPWWDSNPQRQKGRSLLMGEKFYFATLPLFCFSTSHFLSSSTYLLLLSSPATYLPPVLLQFPLNLSTVAWRSLNLVNVVVKSCCADAVRYALISCALYSESKL